MRAECRAMESASLLAMKARLLEAMSEQLELEVAHAAPPARLSARLRAALERLAPGVRAELVARTHAGAAPLLVAARRGNAELVEYLVHVCGAPLEQRGPFEGRSVTPLWAAAAGGHLAALRALADAGAALDARCEDGATPLLAAVQRAHGRAARLLLERGASPAAADHAGVAGLMLAAHAPRLVRLLLARGAPVHARDVRGRTALHYAARDHRADAVRELLVAGADARARCAQGDDALRAAAARAAASVVRLLLAHDVHSPREQADALELLGAAQLEELEDASSALASWRRATALRAAAGLRKAPRAPCAALGGAVEWRSAPELERLAPDLDALRAQALLVTERVLGAQHEDTLYRLMYRGAAEADERRYARCAELWLWGLRLRLERDTLLHADAAHAACALARVLLAGPGARGERPAPDAAERALLLVLRHAAEARRALALRPRCAAQCAAWESALRCVAHLAALAPGGAARAELAALVRSAPRTLPERDTLLHLACSGAALHSAYLGGAAGGSCAPPGAALALLECGADVRARNARGRTALHVAVAAGRAELAGALLAAGAHACTPDARGAAPLMLVAPAPLACVAARALGAWGAEPRLPRALAAFLDLHRYVPDERDGLQPE